MRAYIGLDISKKAKAYTTFCVLLLVFCLTQPLELHPVNDVGLDPYIRAQYISSGNLQREIGLSLLGIFALVTLIGRRPTQPRPTAPLAWFILLYLSWACASIVWSDDPLLTARRVGGLLIMAAGAVAVERSLFRRGVLQLIFLNGTISVAVGLFCEIALGTFHPFDTDYRFWGILNPNFAGWNCSLCLISIVALARNESRRARFAYSFTFIVVAAFLLLTKSRGALAGAILGLAVYSILTSKAKRALPVILACTPLLCLSVLMDSGRQGGNLLQILLLGRGDDAGTLTGRIPFWRYELLPDILSHPVAGYGYGAFWTASRYEGQISDVGWFFPDAHNSLIEVALGLGLVGLGLYIALMVAAFYLSARESQLSPKGGGPFCAAILVCSLANSMLSSIQFEPYLGSFILLVVLAQIADAADPRLLVVAKDSIGFGAAQKYVCKT